MTRRSGIANRAFTGREVEIAVRLSIGGHTDPAIAKAIGRTTASVRGLLDRTGLPGLRCNGDSHGLRLCVPKAAHGLLAAEAERRGMPPERLAAAVLATVATEPNMFANVLDWEA